MHYTEVKQSVIQEIAVKLNQLVAVAKFYDIPVEDGEGELKFPLGKNRFVFVNVTEENARLAGDLDLPVVFTTSSVEEVDDRESIIKSSWITRHIEDIINDIRKPGKGAYLDFEDDAMPFGFGEGGEEVMDPIASRMYEAQEAEYVGTMDNPIAWVY